jgi:hypothetical protein
VTATAGRPTSKVAWLVAVLAGVSAGVGLGAASTAGRGTGTGGLAFWLENVGGLWVAGAFAVGAVSRRWLPGCFGGAITMLTALAFYDLSAGLPPTSILLRSWFIVAVFAGVAFGALGGWWGERPAYRWVPAGLTGGVIAGEALALAVGGFPHPLFSSSLAMAQATAGLGGAALLGGRTGWWRAVLLASLVALAIGLLQVATGVPGRLIWAVIRAESGFDPRAISPKGAQGLMQLMPETAAILGVHDVFDPRENIHAGTRHLKAMLVRFR